MTERAAADRVEVVVRSPTRPLAGRRILAPLASLVLLTATAAADSWLPPAPERFVDANGDHHVNLSPDGHFVYARRAPGSEPLEPTHGDPLGWESEETFPLRGGDVVIARGELSRRPMTVLVSARGRGFVAIDRYAALGHGDVVVVADAHGRVTHRRTLPDLFPKLGTDRFVRSVSSIHWRLGEWLDEDRGAVVIVAVGGHVRLVGMATGSVSAGGPPDLIRALDHSSAKARDLALDVLRDQQVFGIEEALAGMLADESLSRGTRLRVAVVLSERGSPAGRDLVVEAASAPREEGVSRDDHAYAVRNLPVVLGDDALPLLRHALRGPAGDAWSPAQQAFSSLGARAVPTLLEMLAEKAESPDYRGGAAHALKEIGSRQALAGLLQAVGDETAYVANAAANAAIAIGGADCAASFAADLRRGCTQDGRLAMYFAEVQHTDAVPALISLLERGEDDLTRRRATQALRFQTGEDHGADAAAWRRWWEERPR